MTKSITTKRKLFLLGALYLSQGLPFGFFSQALPVMLRKDGVSLEAIGISSLLALPWALKFMWAPWVDRIGSPRFGRRRSWIVPLQLAAALLLLMIAFLPTDSCLQFLLIGVFFVNLLSATQDIATDGLAVDLLEPSERGFGNGIQVGGYRLGMILGGGALLIIYPYIQWSGAFFTMAVAILLASVPIVLHRERKIEREVDENPDLKGFFKRPQARNVIALVTLYKFGEHFATAMLRPFLADQGFTLADIGWLLGTVGFVAGLLGALLGGSLVNALGRKTSLIIFGIFQAATVGGYAILTSGEVTWPWVYLLCGLEHLAGGMATAALFTCMMDWCRKNASATDYTIQASAVVLASGVAAALSGFSAGQFGYPAHFALAFGLALLAVVSTHFLFPQSVTGEHQNEEAWS